MYRHRIAGSATDFWLSIRSSNCSDLKKEKDGHRCRRKIENILLDTGIIIIEIQKKMLGKELSRESN